MKKKIYILSLLFLLLEGCTGYKPIFESKNLDFKISSYKIEGDKNLGNKIYSKLNSLSKKNNNNPNTKSIDILINITKDKIATTKDNAGKILEYKITLYSIIDIKDFLTEEKILYESTNISNTYKTEDQYSDTLSTENRSIENLINNIYQKLLIKLSQKII